MSRASTPLVIGGEPRVDLLPPEVKARIRGRSTRRLLTISVIGVLLICAGSVVGAQVQTTLAQDELAHEQARTQDILAQQVKYSSVRTVKGDIKVVQAAQRVGASTEIDWESYLTQVEKTLPSGVTVGTIVVDSGDPQKAFDRPTVPLQGPRVATVTFTATSDSLAKIPDWLDALKKLPGYVDAMPGAATLAVSTGSDGSGAGKGGPAGAKAVYNLTVVMHVGYQAFTNRFSTSSDDTKVSEATADGANTQAGTSTSETGEK